MCISLLQAQCNLAYHTPVVFLQEESSPQHFRTSRPPSGSNSCSMVPSGTFHCSGPAGSSHHHPSSSQQVLDLGRQGPTGKGLEPPTPSGMYNVGGMYSDSPLSGPTSDPNSSSPHHIDGQHGFKGMGTMDAAGYAAQRRSYTCGGGASTVGGTGGMEWNTSSGGMQRMLPGSNTLVPNTSYGGYRMDSRIGVDMEAPPQRQPQQQQQHNMAMGMQPPMDRGSRGSDFRMGAIECGFAAQGRERPHSSGGRVGEGCIDELSAYQARLPPLRTRNSGRTSPRGSWFEDDSPSLRVSSAPAGGMRAALSMGGPTHFEQQQQQQGIPIPGYHSMGEYVPNLKYENSSMGVELGHREMGGGPGSYPGASGHCSGATHLGGRGYWPERGCYEYERWSRHSSEHDPSPTAALSQHVSALAVDSPMHQGSGDLRGSFGLCPGPQAPELGQHGWQQQQQGGFHCGVGSSISRGVGLLDGGLGSLPLDDSLACVDIPGLVDDRLLADVNFRYMAKECAQMRQQQQGVGLMGPPPPVGMSAAAASHSVAGGGQMLSERVQLLASSLQDLSEEDRAYARQQLLLKAQKAAMQHQQGMAPTCSSGGSMLSRGAPSVPSTAVSAPQSGPMPQMLHGPSRLSSTSPAIEPCAAAAEPGGCSSSSLPMETCSAPMQMQDFTILGMGAQGMQAQAVEGGLGGGLGAGLASIVKQEGAVGQDAYMGGHLQDEADIAVSGLEQMQQTAGMQAQLGGGNAYPSFSSGSVGLGQTQRFSPSPSIPAGPVACSSPLKRTTAQLAAESVLGVAEEAVGSPLKRPCNKILPELPSFNTLVEAEASEDDLFAWGNSGSLPSLVALGMKSPTDGGTGELLRVPEEDATHQVLSDADMWAVLTDQ